MGDPKVSEPVNFKDDPGKWVFVNIGTLVLACGFLGAIIIFILFVLHFLWELFF